MTTQMMEPILEVQAEKKVSLTKIMVLTDFSAVSDLALQYALAIARRYDARIYLTHIISPDAYQLAEPTLAELSLANSAIALCGVPTVTSEPHL